MLFPHCLPCLRYPSFERKTFPQCSHVSNVALRWGFFASSGRSCSKSPSKLPRRFPGGGSCSKSPSKLPIRSIRETFFPSSPGGPSPSSMSPSKPPRPAAIICCFTSVLRCCCCRSSHSSIGGSIGTSSGSDALPRLRCRPDAALPRPGCCRRQQYKAMQHEVRKARENAQARPMINPIDH